MSDAYEKFVRGLWFAAGMIALVALLLLCLFLWHLDVDAREIKPTITDLRRTIVIVSGSATNLEKTLALERQAASAQIASAQQVTAQLAVAGAAANRLIAHTDVSLNGDDLRPGLLRQLSATIEEQQDRLSQMESVAQENLQDLDDAEKQITPAIANFNRASSVLADGLPPILGNVIDTTAQTVAIGQNTADTTHQLDLTAQDIRAFVHRETTPVRGTWNVIKGFLAEFAGPAAQVATAAK